jgi:hypothetical protein
MRCKRPVAQMLVRPVTIVCLAGDICANYRSQGMQQMLDETQADSANMRRMYVALGDRIADVMRSHCCRQAAGQPPPDLQQVWHSHLQCWI